MQYCDITTVAIQMRELHMPSFFKRLSILKRIQI